MKRIAVFGTGTIGSGQATLISGNGLPTVILGHTKKGMESCWRTILQNWDDLIREGVATRENREAAMDLITITDQPESLAGCEVVFEAVSEKWEVKTEAYRVLGQCCSKDTVIASCTSSIQAESLAKLIPNPERFLIAHPFQPVHLLPLVELVKHEKTAEWAVSRMYSLLEQLHRKVVLLNKCVPGFLVNRLAQALFRESIDLISQNICSAEDIDQAVKYAIGMRYASIGLLEYFDDVGFELESEIAKNVYPNLCNAVDVQPAVLEGLRSGETGRAAGHGLYDWTAKDQKDFLRRKQLPYFDTVSDWN